MSLPIWTPAALASEHQPYAARVWRMVEAQHKVSTLKLTDTLEEQALLEEIIEESKPLVPPECRHLDYLLATPFRYGAIYPHGSRFRRAGLTPGVFYAAEQAETAAAETDFYRLLFFAESPTTPWPSNPGEYTAFAVEVATDTALDLTIPPLNRDADQWCHLTDYEACQALAEQAREAGTDLIRYHSVRDPAARANVAILSCTVFQVPAPVATQTWRIKLGPQGALAICEHPKLGLTFDRQSFAADPRIAGLAWSR